MLVSGVDEGKNVLTTISFYLFSSRKLLSITFPSHPFSSSLSFRLARHLPHLPLPALAYPIHLPISPLPFSASSFACAPTRRSRTSPPPPPRRSLPICPFATPSLYRPLSSCLPSATPCARTLHPCPLHSSLGNPSPLRRSPSLHPIANPHALAPLLFPITLSPSLPFTYIQPYTCTLLLCRLATLPPSSSKPPCHQAIKPLYHPATLFPGSPTYSHRDPAY